MIDRNTPTPAPTAAPAPAKTRAPREVPVHLVTVTLELPTGDDGAMEETTRDFFVQGTEAQVEAHMVAKLLKIRRATLHDAQGRNDVLVEQAGGAS